MLSLWKYCKIKKIKVKPNFYFVLQEDITIVGRTPLSKMFMDDIQLIEVKYYILSNTTIYL
jgi:hypothetical protein